MNILKESELFSFDDESAVLGAAFVNSYTASGSDSTKIAFSQYKEYGLKATDFYRVDHQLIFEAMQALHEEGADVTVTSVKEYCIRHNTFDKIGGMQTLLYLDDTMPYANNIGKYIRVVKDFSARRHIIKRAYGILGEISDTLQNPVEVVTRGIEDLNQISMETAPQKEESILDLVCKSMSYAEAVHLGKKEVAGVPFGFNRLDKLVGGMGRGSLTIIGAGAGVGKTTFALNVAKNLLEKNYHVAMISLEMDNVEEIIPKICCNISSVPADKIFQASTAPQEETQKYWDRYVQACDKLSQYNLSLVDKCFTFDDICNKARIIHAKNPIDLLIIDHLHIILPARGQKADNRNNEIGQYTRTLKALAKQLNIPIMLLSQLNEEGQKAHDKVERVEDISFSLYNLRDSGNIGQDANNVICIGGRPNHPDNKIRAERIFHVVKCRANSAGGKVKMTMYGKISRFEEVGAEVGINANYIKPKKETRFEKSLGKEEAIDLYKDQLD